MTTIAYKDGVMAADTGLFAEDIVWGRVQKVYRLQDGSLFGWSGDGDGRKILELVEKHGHNVSQSQLLELDADFNAILVLPDERIWLIDSEVAKPEPRRSDVGAYEILADAVAIGIGAKIAIGAMKAGASAQHAIEITAEVDRHTVLPVFSMRLHDTA